MMYHRTTFCITTCVSRQQQAAFCSCSLLITKILYLRAYLRVYLLGMMMRVVRVHLFPSECCTRTRPNVCSNEEHPRKKQALLFAKKSVPWDCGLVSATMVSYYGGLHLPLSYSGLSLVATLLHQNELDPQLKAESLVVLQTLELCGAVWLIESNIKPFGSSSSSMTSFGEMFRSRGWIVAAAIASFSILLLVARPTPVSAEGNSSYYDPALKELLSDGDAALCATLMVYCLITPLLEEYVYRGFVLTSLATYVSLPWAIVTSSMLFSLSHFNLPGALFLFLIGCVLGAAYACTGDWAASLAIHSLYNLLVLMYTILT